MSEDVLLVLRTLFGGIWSIFTTWYIPGTNITPASWAMFSLTLYAAVRFIKRLLGGDPNGDK